jgi:hypothetical protein
MLSCATLLNVTFSKAVRCEQRCLLLGYTIYFKCLTTGRLGDLLKYWQLMWFHWCHLPSMEMLTFIKMPVTIYGKTMMDTLYTPFGVGEGRGYTVCPLVNVCQSNQQKSAAQLELGLGSEESVILDEYSTGKESSDSDDSISTFLAKIKQSGRKPPARRKCGLIKSRKQLHHKGAKKSNKKISRLKQAENANTNYRGCHCPSIGVTVPGKLWLVLFRPQSSDCEPNGIRCCRSPQSHCNSLRLDDPGSVEEFVSEIHCIQKVPCQLTFNSRLHVKLHAVTEESGIAWVNAELSPLVKGGLVKFPNTMDHFYNPLHPEWPLVIKTNNVKVCRGDSLLTHLTG